MNTPLRFSLGFNEAEYEQHRAAVRAIANNPALYPDLIHAEVGWILPLIHNQRQERLIDISKELISTGLPIICWSTNILGVVTGGDFKGHGTLFAVWGMFIGNTDYLDKLLPLSSAVYCCHPRIREVHSRSGAWHLEFAANCDSTFTSPSIIEAHREIIELARKKHQNA